MNKFNFKLKPNEMAVIFTENNRFYYSNFFSSDGVLLCFYNELLLFVDGRYYESAQKTATNVKVVLLNNLNKQIKDIVEKKHITKVYCENNISLFEYNNLKKQLCQIQLFETDLLTSYISEQRQIKSNFEIECIKKAQKIAETSLDQVLKYIKPGITEKQIAAELEYKMKLCGADGISFETIAISGKNTSLPHGVPTNKQVQSGDFVTMDFGAVYNGYHSDMTRTVAVGTATEKMKNIYNVVLNANIAAINKVKQGIKASEVDLTARQIIENAGYGDCFVHSTGHGVGLDIHETPNVSFKNEKLLCKNQVITVEPGIYLPNEFGVRIEDTVVVKNNTAENLTHFNKNLIII